MYGQRANEPYENWPSEALERLGDDIGRNGELSELQKSIKKRIEAILSERAVPKVSGRRFGY